MDPRITVITLGVSDVERARSFYVDGLGWPARLVVPGEVLMLDVAPGFVLSLWDLEHMRAEIGPVGATATAPMTLAHNVAGPDAVLAVLAEAVAAGATLVSPGQRREWGGFSGYFADPDGHRWEVAHNPSWTVDARGAVLDVDET